MGEQASGSSQASPRGLALLGLLLALSLWLAAGPAAQGAERPHIVYILADDMGQGDVQAYRPASSIPTPHLNALADAGMRFTDAHSPSAVCTPTRYGVLTGRYPWRTRLKKSVIFPPGEPLIQQSRLTVAELLQQAGYRTACVGKWHLGLGWPMQQRDGQARIDFDRPLQDGPNDHGFDHSFIMAGSADMPPYCYIENGEVVNKPTVQVPKEAFGRAGLAVQGLKAEDLLPRFTRHAVDVIEQHGEKDTDQPLFMYFPLTAPHKPVAPSEPFQDSTDMGPYGDFVHEVDHTVGRIVKALKAQGMYDNTLLIFTSDNGTSPNAARSALKRGHVPSNGFRGMKADIYEGGHRVPFIASWPGQIEAGAVSDALISLNDLMRTAAALTDQTLPQSAAVDSRNIWPVLSGAGSAEPVYSASSPLVVASIRGFLGARTPQWKLCLCPGSGGWSEPRPGPARQQDRPAVQLYELTRDADESNNLQATQRQRVRRLKRQLRAYLDRGRSTPGAKQANWQGQTRWPAVEAVE
jgi:arylsulfatase A-like enzyme